MCFSLQASLFLCLLSSIWIFYDVLTIIVYYYYLILIVYLMILAWGGQSGEYNINKIIPTHKDYRWYLNLFFLSLHEIIEIFNLFSSLLLTFFSLYDTQSRKHLQLTYFSRHIASLPQIYLCKVI